MIPLWIAAGLFGAFLTFGFWWFRLSMDTVVEARALQYQVQRLDERFDRMCGPHP